MPFGILAWVMFIWQSVRICYHVARLREEQLKM